MIGDLTYTLFYDPLNRLDLSYVNANATGTRFDYDHEHLATETVYPTGTMLRRYVFGPGADAPLVWYEGSTTTDKRWLIPDERGSIIAVTNASGTAIAVNSYDDYGITASTSPANMGRFLYTGQAWLPEVGLYYYKARLYSPTLGRFMQTDPIGYGDGVNWYNYVGSDPVNATDSTGLGDHIGDDPFDPDVLTARGGTRSLPKFCVDIPGPRGAQACFARRDYNGDGKVDSKDQAYVENMFSTLWAGGVSSNIPSSPSNMQNGQAGAPGTNLCRVGTRLVLVGSAVAAAQNGTPLGRALTAAFPEVGLGVEVFSDLTFGVGGIVSWIGC